MTRKASPLLHLLAVACCWASLGCEETRRAPTEPQATEPSPNASILPAPLASEIEVKGRHLPIVDAGVVPDGAVDAGPLTTRWLREDQGLEADPAPAESSGIRLLARFRWLDLPPFPRLPEANTEAIARLKEALAFELLIDLASSGRMRVRFDSDAFLLRRGTELLARLDHLGHLLSWTDVVQKYSIVPAGTLRAVLGEQRLDSTPLAKPKVASLAAGSVLGMPTEKTELSTPLGRIVIDQTNLASAGGAGKLLCRMLGELVAADPINPSCERALLPLRAELFTRAGGHVLFEVQKVERDRSLDGVLAPPAGARFAGQQLPPSGEALVLTPERLRELRLRAVPRSEKPEASAPKQGLVVQNRSDVVRYVLLDGVVLARVPARAELSADALLPGKYAVVALDFFGEDPTPLRILELPTRLALGEEAESAR